MSASNLYPIIVHSHVCACAHTCQNSLLKLTKEVQLWLSLHDHKHLNEKCSAVVSQSASGHTNCLVVDVIGETNMKECHYQKSSREKFTMEVSPWGKT